MIRRHCVFAIQTAALMMALAVLVPPPDPSSRDQFRQVACPHCGLVITREVYRKTDHSRSAPLMPPGWSLHHDFEEGFERRIQHPKGSPDCEICKPLKELDR